MARDFDKKLLWKSITKEQRLAARSKISSLKAAVREARVSRATAKEAAKVLCATQRTEARAQAQRILASAKRRAKDAMIAARSACHAAKLAPHEKLSALRGQILEEKRHQAEMRAIARSEKRFSRKPGVVSARTYRSESDDEVRQNIPSDLVHLFDRMKRSIKAGSRMSRTEAFMQYVHENPREKYAASEDATDAIIREMQARQRAGGDRRRRRRS
jgi:hypothetical protein